MLIYVSSASKAIKPSFCICKRRRGQCLCFRYIYDVTSGTTYLDGDLIDRH
jgi:hypothetical protein